MVVLHSAKLAEYLYSKHIWERGKRLQKQDLITFLIIHVLRNPGIRIEKNRFGTLRKIEHMVIHRVTIPGSLYKNSQIATISQHWDILYNILKMSIVVVII